MIVKYILCLPIIKSPRFLLIFTHIIVIVLKLEMSTYNNNDSRFDD